MLDVPVLAMVQSYQTHNLPNEGTKMDMKITAIDLTDEDRTNFADQIAAWMRELREHRLAALRLEMLLQGAEQALTALDMGDLSKFITDAQRSYY